MSTAAIFQSEHLIFLVPMCAALLWVVLGLLMGTVMSADADVEFEADADADADVDADADGDHGVSLGGVLSFFGVGDIPMLLWLEILAILWGVTGLVVSINAGMFMAVPVAAAVSLIGTAGLARVIQRIMPQKIESDALVLGKAIGLLGRVTSTKVDERYGEGVFEGSHNVALYLPIRIEPGGTPLPEHRPIVVVGVDESEGFAYVMATEELVAEGGK